MKVGWKTLFYSKRSLIFEKYLKLPNCCFELVQITKNGDFKDRIFPIVLEDGKIIERGKHSELLALKSFFYQLYLSQFKGNTI